MFPFIGDGVVCVCVGGGGRGAWGGGGGVDDVDLIASVLEFTYLLLIFTMFSFNNLQRQFIPIVLTIVYF